MANNNNNNNGGVIFDFGDVVDGNEDDVDDDILGTKDGDVFVNGYILRALQNINVDSTNQVLTIDARLFFTIDDIDMRRILKFFKDNPKTVNQLKLYFGEFLTFSTEATRLFFSFLATTTSLQHIHFRGVPLCSEQDLLSCLNRSTSVTGLDLNDFDLDGQRGVARQVQAVENCRIFLATTTIHRIYLFWMDLGNVHGARLLSGLHCNTSVTYLRLNSIGLEGVVGGGIVSYLLQQMPHLNELRCSNLALGTLGARALQGGLRANQTVDKLSLSKCHLGDEGLSAVVDALEDNNIVTYLELCGNDITPNGLPHLLRLLQRQSPWLFIDVDDNRGLFDDEEKRSLFLSALGRKMMPYCLSLNFCGLSGDAVIDIFDKLANSTAPVGLYVYENEQLHGACLKPLLPIIPMMKTLDRLHVNLDFTDKSVLSSFHWNTSIRYLLRDSNEVEITDGPVFGILKRNRLLNYANNLLDCDSQGMGVPLGLWSKALERLTRDVTGATAAFNIMQKMLPPWWEAQVTATAASPSSPRIPPARKRARHLYNE